MEILFLKCIVNYMNKKISLSREDLRIIVEYLNIAKIENKLLLKNMKPGEVCSFNPKVDIKLIKKMQKKFKKFRKCKHS